MKQFLNTLYVTTQGAYLAREGETLLVRVEEETKLRLPVHTLQGIVCFGRVSMSPPAMELCADQGIGVSFLTETGRFMARVTGKVNGNVLLRREQYRRADNAGESAGLARCFIAAKIANSRAVLQRGARDYPEGPGAADLDEAARRLARILELLDDAVPLDTLRAREGEAASVYFGVFDHLFVAQKDDFFLRDRSRRPPLDNANALLSFLYTLLAHDVASALEGVGLDPSVGFLHRDRPGRPGLALDLMEELRPFLADRLALTLVNRQQVNGRGFVRTESGAIRMDDDTRKAVLVAWQKRKMEVITHPFLGEKMAIGLLPHAQALLLARYLRGDGDAYPPLLAK